MTYDAPAHDAPGKTGDHTDVVNGRFVSLLPPQHIVQVVEFDSDDPSFAGAMTMTWTFDPVPGGTEVRIRCDNVPVGIRKEDHDAGLASTLANLAAYAERRAAMSGS